MQKLKLIILLILFILSNCNSQKNHQDNFFTTIDDANWFILTKEDVSNTPYHTNHYDFFGKSISGFNTFILKAIDTVQSKAMDGGGYFIGINAKPTESPIGYKLSLFGQQLLTPPRTTSYCSGSTYSAFIESLNMIYKNKSENLSEARFESLRMQEPDDSRRNDGIKFWGKWNDDGFGNHFALVQYSEMGTVIKPANARPGDFLNISWKSGGGHSVIFLGWYINQKNEKCVVYWSSQKSTNGLGDAIVPINKIREVMFVRLTSPGKLFTFDTEKQVDDSIKGYLINW